MIEIVYLTLLTISLWFGIFFLLKYIESFVYYYRNCNDKEKEVFGILTINRFWLTVFSTLIIYLLFFV
jgi:hypothetical protein